MQRRLSTPNNKGDASLVTAGHNISYLTTPLLREWAKLRLTAGSWKDALESATNVSILLP